MLNEHQIKEFLKKGKLWRYIIDEELEKKHKGDIKTKEVVFLCALGRLVKNKKSFSFNVILLSPSSSGKDYLVSSILELFPEEDYEHYKRVSPKALNYLHAIKKAKEGEEQPEPYNYDGKILYLEEIEENVLNTEVMKGFTSGEDKINRCAITKDKGRGVDTLEVMGHPCVFTTTATTTPTEEIRNRFNIIGLDLSEEQTERTFTDENIEYSEEIKGFIKNLKSYEVEIPKEMFNFIKKNFPKNKVRFRRDFQRIIDFIKAVALFNQEERRGHSTDTIRAEPQDYNIAKEVFENAFSCVSDIPLKDIDRRIIKALEEAKETPLTAKEIVNSVGIITIQNLYPHLRDLENKEVINQIQDRDVFNNLTSKFVLSEEFRDKIPFKLPLYDD